MAQDDGDRPLAARDDTEELGAAEFGHAPRRRLVARLAAALGIVAVAAIAVLWLARERLANSLITQELASLGLPATYDIVSIGPRRQVFANVVVGDPAHPDLTIARAELTLAPRLGLPGVAKLTLVRPRLAGRYVAGRLSFGSLDPLVFGNRSASAPFRLPDLALTITDGQTLLRTDLGGPIALRLTGAGPLRDGFAGSVALAAPVLAMAGCRAGPTTVEGRLAVRGERPRFVGPVTTRSLACAALGVRVADAAIAADLWLDRRLDGLQGTLTLHTGALAAPAVDVRAATGDGRLTWRNRALTAQYRLGLERITTSQASARTLGIAGTLRAGRDAATGAIRIASEGTLSGGAFAPGAGLDAGLARTQRASAGSFAAPLLARLRGALARQLPASALDGRFVLRQGGGMLSLVVPEARVTGVGRGDLLLALSRATLTLRDGHLATLDGAFVTGGDGLPAITGKLASAAAGPLAIDLAMAPYAASGASLAIPRLRVSTARSATGADTIAFNGAALIDGPLPGGGATHGLVLPLAGDWAPAAGLALWRDCATLRFDSLRLAELSLDARALVLCPPPGGAIVRADAHGTRFAAGAPALSLTGRLGATPIRIESGAIGAAWPGIVTARDVAVVLGPPDAASRFRLASLDARIGSDISGHFAGSQAALATVPLDLTETTGAWRYAAGRLAITGAGFRLVDRADPARFAPLIARDASLSLVANAIVAEATLRAPASDRAVVRAHIVHDLTRGSGHADLTVAPLTFDKALQPDALTPLALGVIANAAGTVAGDGRIDWTPAGITSSGRFSTEGLDFAAAFGPVKGLSGTIVFTDLLGMVTAPAQVRLASINPGIEVNDGVLDFALRPGLVVAVAGARWPFMGGTLNLEPVTMTLGATETRRYTLTIAGLDAALFVARMDLGNLNATGIFDGALPLVFDAGGSGRIEDGHLAARPPGGNVSYVGALTYKDLSAMANFAFDALKSLDFNAMTVAMDGPLDGEIVTRLRFTGVRQGATARRNFITRRLGQLPLQFNVNLRAPFFQLATSFKSLYDPAFVRDPRAIGLIDANGRPLPPAAPPAVPPGPAAGAAPAPIQPPASGPVR